MVGNMKGADAALREHLVRLSRQFQKDMVEPIGPVKEADFENMQDAEIEAYLAFRGFKIGDVTRAQRQLLQRIQTIRASEESLSGEALEATTAEFSAEFEVLKARRASLDDLTEAVADYEQAVAMFEAPDLRGRDDLNPARAGARLALGEARVDIGELAGAKANLDAALDLLEVPALRNRTDLDPDRARAHLVRGTVLQALGDSTKASDEVRAAVASLVAKVGERSARVQAWAFDLLRDLLMPPPAALAAARRSLSVSPSAITRGIRSAEAPRSTEVSLGVGTEVLEQAFQGLDVIPVGWAPRGKGKTEFMLYCVRDWPAESARPTVIIDDQPVTVSAFDQSKRHKLMYLTLDVEPVKLASCEMTLVDGVLTLKLQTARAAGDR